MVLVQWTFQNDVSLNHMNRSHCQKIQISIMKINVLMMSFVFVVNYLCDCVCMEFSKNDGNPYKKVYGVFNWKDDFDYK